MSSLKPGDFALFQGASGTGKSFLASQIVNMVIKSQTMKVALLKPIDGKLVLKLDN